MNLFTTTLGIAFAAALVLGYLFLSIRVVREWERGVMLFLGRYVGVKGPGLRLVFFPFYRMQIIGLRTIVEDVPPQDVITLDNVSSRVNAVIYFRVVYPEKAVLQVENYLYATSQLAQTTLRSIVGAHPLDDLLSEREKLNRDIQVIMDERSDPWGIKVSSVEIKHVEVPSEMRRVMARQAEAERERRAKVISAEGEFQAATKIADAAELLATQPGTLQLRYLQTLVEVAAGNNSTVVFPLPIEFLEALGGMRTDGARPRRPTPVHERKSPPSA
ncbi:MAG: slipin family protein [Polyangiaceae bacterium]|nr:slipin family protein [Polyangiaceae bacterium]